MIHGSLDRTAPVPDVPGETSAQYGFGCLACSVAVPLGRRGPMPTYCRRCAKRLQNLRARAAPATGVAPDPRSPVLAQRLAARAELADVERRLADLDRRRRELVLADEQARRHALRGDPPNPSAASDRSGKAAVATDRADEVQYEV